MLEREGELSQIDGLLGRAREGAGGVVLVEGPAGIGKTALLSEARARAAALGMVVLRARGGELERELPLDAVRQLFERRLAKERTTWLTGTAARGAAALGYGEGAPDDLAGIVQGLYWLTAELAEQRPLLLSIDDVQWADRATQSWLAYLSRRIDDLPVAVVLGVRTGEPDAEPVDIEAVRLRPQPLSAGAVRTLVQERRPDAGEAFSAACHRASRGNPFYAIELLRAGDAVDEQSPETIARSVAKRLARLPEPATQVARAAAVLGEDDALLRHVGDLAGVAPPAAAATVDRLVEAGLLTDERPLRFEHPVVRAAVYSGIGSGDRAQMHGRAAGLLAQEGAAPERVARHLLRSEPAGDSGSVATLRAAAARALHTGDDRWSVELLERALAEPPSLGERPAILFELGQAALAGGDPSGIEHLQAALELTDDREARMPLLMALAGGVAQHHGTAAGIPYLDELAEAQPSPSEGLGIELLRFGLARTVPDLLEDALARLAVVRERSGAEGDPRLLALLAGERAYANAPVAEVLALADAAIAAGVFGADIERGPWTGELFDALLIAGAADRAETFLTAELARLRAEHRTADAVYLTGTRGWARMEQGELRGAEADLRRVVELVPELDINVAPSEALLGVCLLRRGDLGGARAALERAIGGVELSPADFIVTHCEGLVLLAEGDPRGALGALRRTGELMAPHGLVTPAMILWRVGLARAHQTVGELTEAEREAREHTELARASGAPVALGAGLVALGAATQSLETLEEAVATLEGTTGRYELAVALYQLGLELRRRRALTEAREPLARAFDLADRCGAEPLAGLARGELVSVGARPRRARLSGLEALTPRERQVAELAGSGLTNREIAQALFLSLKTVEKHLGSAYQKLNIEAREHLASVLG